ncbi:MAG: hypothetical protein ACHQVS_03195, partial [Candidatus Babeliales bacterium]
MIKKILCATIFCSVTLLCAQERKEIPASATKLPITLSGTVPFKIDMPALPQATHHFVEFAEVLGKSTALKDAISALNLKESFAALGASAAEKLKEINITSEALQNSAKAISTITLKHELVHKHVLEVPAADELATRGFGGVAFLYTLVHGSHPVITGFFGCLTFAPYSEIKAQINRCFNHKRP